MITEKRIAYTKAKLNNEIVELRRYVAKVNEMLASDLLAKQAGKVVNKRMLPIIAQAYGLQPKKLWHGGEYLPANWEPAHYLKCSAVEIEIPLPKWGKFTFPLATNEDGRLDAEKTAEMWRAETEKVVNWIVERGQALARVDECAAVYNEVEAKARALTDSLRKVNRYGIETTTLCAFGGHIYDRLHEFAYDESDIPEEARD